MLSLDATQQRIIAADAITVSWLFDVTDGETPSSDYYWSTKTRTWGGQSYEFRVRPESFRGVQMHRSRSEHGIIAPSGLTFEVVDPDGEFTASEFEYGAIVVRLVMDDGTDEEEIRSWKFMIQSAVKAYHKIVFECVDFLQVYSAGSYPNTQLVRDLFASSDSVPDDNVCVPVPFGTAYVPLRSVYVDAAIDVTATTIAAVASSNGGRCSFTDSGSGLGDFERDRYITVSGFTNAANNGTFRALSVAAGKIEVSKDAGLAAEAAGDSVTIEQGTRYYILGPDGYTYSISEARSPRLWGRKSVWTSAGYTFDQSTINDGTTDWKAFQPIVVDLDGDGTPEVPGLWQQGEQFLDLPTKFTRSDTSTMTGPAEIIETVLEDIGVPSADLDTGAGSTFSAAATVYSGWGLEFNGAFWYKRSREQVLAALLNQCHSTLIVGEKVQLSVLSATSQATITASDVIKMRDVGEGTFSRKVKKNRTINDCGYVAWQESGEAQDRFLKSRVPAKSSSTQVSQEVLEVPFVQDSQDVQRIGSLYYQRKLLPDGEVSFTGMPALLALQPDDVITLNDSDRYGGSYDVLIDSITIRRDGAVDIQAITHSASLDDWGDLAPSAITVPDDDTISSWQPVIAGGLDAEAVATMGHDVWGVPYLTVGPTAGAGKFTDIQEALNALAGSRHSGIFLLDGTYLLSAQIYLPDRDLAILGESQAGVVVKNNPGDRAFYLSNLTSNIALSRFTIESRNSGSHSYMIGITGTNAASNSADIVLEGLRLVLSTPTAHDSADDSGINANPGSGELRIKGCLIEGGRYGVSVTNYDWAKISDNSFKGQAGAGAKVSALGRCAIADNRISDFWYMGINASPGDIDACQVMNNRLVCKDDSLTDDDLIGIRVYGAPAGDVVGNSVTLISSRSGDVLTKGIEIYQKSRAAVSNNIIIVEVVSEDRVYGVSCYEVDDSEFHGNVIKVDNTDTTENQYGIRFTGLSHGCRRNVVSENNIDMVNNDAKDRGIDLSSGSNNNQGGDNITYNCGTSIVDSGTGNDVTAQDV